ncbi:MAG: pectin acetylesterase-family hydrolase [Pseudomonadota bacterium]
MTFGILDATSPTNPAANYNLGYVPYCDGTFFAGDRDVDSDGDGTDDRFFRGVQNLAASLDVIAGRYPAPSKILLAGNSAGGFGTHFALPLVRKLYPDVPIELVNDSGVGVSAPGVLDTLAEYWNAGASFPSSCETCIGEDGHLTDYHKYQLAQDPNLRMGFLSYTRDATVVAGLPITPEAWEAELLEAMAELREDYPDRFRSLIAHGDGHTFIIRDFTRVVGGVSVQQWIADMLSGSDDWVSVSD